MRYYHVDVLNHGNAENHRTGGAMTTIIGKGRIRQQRCQRRRIASAAISSASCLLVLYLYLYALGPFFPRRGGRAHPREGEDGPGSGPGPRRLRAAGRTTKIGRSNGGRREGEGDGGGGDADDADDARDGPHPLLNMRLAPRDDGDDGGRRGRDPRVAELARRGKGRTGKFEPDGDEKERRASDKIRAAARSILRPSFDRLEKSRYNIRASAGVKKINDEDEDEDESAPKKKAVSLSERIHIIKEKAVSLSERIYIIFRNFHLNAVVLCIIFIVSGTRENLEQKDVRLEEASAPLKSRIANKKEVAPKQM
jgi:hypothetical protein